MPLGPASTPPTIPTGAAATDPAATDRALAWRDSRALSGPAAPPASAAFVRQQAALADFVDLYTVVPNGARTSYAGASSSAIAAPNGAGAADAPPLAPTAGLHSAKVVPTRRPLAAQRSAVTPRMSAAPRTHTAEFDAEVKERFNKWSTGMYAKNSFLFEIGATARLEQVDRIREELEVEWQAAGRPLFREAEQLLVRGDLNTTAPWWFATLRAAPSSGGPRVGQQQSEAAASREVCDEVLRRLDLDPDAPIDLDARDMALRGLRWEELLAPTRPMARGGDAKMHSTPSRDDGVEHTSASVAAAASATTALRRQLRPATPAAAAAPLAAGRWRPKTMEDATKYGEKHAQLSGVMPYDWCSASLFSKGPDKVAGRHRTKGLFLHYPRESPHNGYVTPEGHGTDHTMRLLERAMQGPAGACLLETIDYLDDLDGPNPLKMGKQKYCFVKHFWRTLNLAQKDQWRVAKVRKLSSVMVDEIVLRGSTGMDCIVAGKNPLKIWPLLLTTAAKIARLKWDEALSWLQREELKGGKITYFQKLSPKFGNYSKSEIALLQSISWAEKGGYVGPLPTDRELTDRERSIFEAAIAKGRSDANLHNVAREAELRALKAEKAADREGASEPEVKAAAVARAEARAARERADELSRSLSESRPHTVAREAELRALKAEKAADREGASEPEIKAAAAARAEARAARQRADEHRLRCGGGEAAVRLSKLQELRAEAAPTAAQRDKIAQLEAG
eukprot:jgi/Chrpa1/20902/Chrysochromulina_OHIO_Genome00025694-RA